MLFSIIFAAAVLTADFVIALSTTRQHRSLAAHEAVATVFLDADALALTRSEHDVVISPADADSALRRFLSSIQASLSR